MTSSLCPHLVQEYFERVSEILAAYRPQILQQIVYDKICENLVLRGAVRQEEHERILQCPNPQGQVNQMLVVIQNRMWGLENLLASFMEEHMSQWLTQEMFRAYMEHLVNPLKKQRDSPVCQCVQLSNSVLYRGWIKALKSLDSWIYKTGTSLGFMKGTMYPTDNMLAFLNDKLAVYTGGDSKHSEGELAPYGFAPNAAGEVQVAELEEDDINDLISLTETMSIAFHSQQEQDSQCIPTFENNSSLMKNSDNRSVMFQTETPLSEMPVIDEQKSGQKHNSITHRPPQSPSKRQRRSSESTGQSEATTDKLTKQQQLIARLSAPKTVRTSPSQNSPVRLRNAHGLKQRPKSAEFHRSTSISQSSTSPSPTESSSNLSKSDKPTPGKTSGFVRCKTAVPRSPKGKTGRLPQQQKPTAVAKPNCKTNYDPKSEEITSSSDQKDNAIDNSCLAEENAKRNTAPYAGDKINLGPTNESELEFLDDTSLFQFDENETPSGITSLFLSNTIFTQTNGLKRNSDGELHTKNYDYYQLNYDLSDSDE